MPIDTLSAAKFMELPILAIRHVVLLPEVILPLAITRKRSLALVRQAYDKGEHLLVVAQREADQAVVPTTKDLYKRGTLAKVLRVVELPKRGTHVILRAYNRFAIKEIQDKKGQLYGHGHVLKDRPVRAADKEHLSEITDDLKIAFLRLMAMSAEIPNELKRTLQQIKDNVAVMHFIAVHTPLSVSETQRLLEALDVMRRGRLLLGYLEREIQMLEVRNEIQEKTYTDIDQQQRDYFLRQQIKVLQNELGAEGSETEIEELCARATQKKWPKEAEKQFEKELERLRRSMPSMPEYSLSLNYLEFMLSLPWHCYAADRLNIEQAKRILERNHFGIEKVKSRILEHLAVMQLTDANKGSILCLAGPPGVGKTSLGRSIAEALGRPFVRIALGGMHDEAEIRGHRKTYVGAMPGRILQQMARLEVSNPVMVLDEVDKLQRDFRGDPGSALLEALDPAQNHTFVDNYLEVDYDLSKTFFLATANSIEHVPVALRDRLEVIEMSGYTMDEKREIARKYLLPQAKKAHGLQSSGLRFSPSALQHLIQNYTSEAGVRNLDRALAEVMRKLALSIAQKEPHVQAIGPKEIQELLGPVRYVHERYQKSTQPGICMGLAWTAAGGELMQIEATCYAGKGEVKLSGQLGSVMQESALASLSYLRAHAHALGLDEESFRKNDLHVHVPAGAVPKDGPSAGITLLTAMASLYTHRSVLPRLAMSGELTLSGRILPVGGIKEKLLAARAGGIRTLILSEENRKDVEVLDQKYLKGLDIRYKSQASEVLFEALSLSLLQDEGKLPKKTAQKKGA